MIWLIVVEFLTFLDNRGRIKKRRFYDFLIQEWCKALADNYVEDVNVNAQNQDFRFFKKKH